MHPGFEVFDAVGCAVFLELVVEAELAHFLREGAGAVAPEEVDEHAAEFEEELAGVVVVGGEDLFAEPLEGGLEADVIELAGLDAVVDGEDYVLWVVLDAVADGVEGGFGEAALGGFHGVELVDAHGGIGILWAIDQDDGAIGEFLFVDHAVAHDFLKLPGAGIFIGVVRTGAGGHAPIEEDVFLCPDGQRLVGLLRESGGGEGGEEVPAPPRRGGGAHSRNSLKSIKSSSSSSCQSATSIISLSSFSAFETLVWSSLSRALLSRLNSLGDISTMLAYSVVLLTFISAFNRKSRRREGIGWLQGFQSCGGCGKFLPRRGGLSRRPGRGSAR